MKKTRSIISLLLAFMLVIGCAVVPAAAETISLDSVNPTCTLAFHNTLEWEDVYEYAWDNDGDVTPTWPGVKINPIGKDDYGYEIYALDIYAGAKGIIVNNGKGAQTVEITDFAPAGGGYYLDADMWTETGYIPIPLEGEVYTIGDADGNETINIDDVTAIQKYLAGAPVPKSFNIKAADTDQNDEVTINDGTLIQLYLANNMRDRNYCGLKKESDTPPKDDYQLCLCDVLGWGKVSLIARDKNGNRLPNTDVENDFLDDYYILTFPADTASLTIVSEDGTKRTDLRAEDIARIAYLTCYIAWDKDNSRYVLDYRIPGGLIPEVNFINSLGWDHVVAEEWDKYGNMVSSTELESDTDRYEFTPAFYTSKVAFSDGNGHKTDFITNFYTLPGEGDFFTPDENNTTVNENGETVYAVIRRAHKEGSESFSLTNSLGWKNVYVYAWNDNGDELNGTWPGQKLEPYDTNGYGQEMYRVSVSISAAGFILTDGEGHQTVAVTDFPGDCFLSDETELNEFGETVYKLMPYYAE